MERRIGVSRLYQLNPSRLIVGDDQGVLSESKQGLQSWFTEIIKTICEALLTSRMPDLRLRSSYAGTNNNYL